MSDTVPPTEPRGSWLLSPDEIASRQFLVSLRGYDRDEVDRFLDEVASTVAELQRQIRELEDEAGVEPARVPAQREPSTEVAPAPSAEVAPRDAFKSLGEETTRILVAAEESARAIKHKAEERAQQELETARREARDEVESARRTASKVVADAERRRNQIAEDARNLESVRDRLADQLREAVRVTTATMRGLAPAPSESGPDEPRELSAPEPAGGRAVPHDREARAARSKPASEDDEDASGSRAGTGRGLAPSPEPVTPTDAGPADADADAAEADDLWDTVDEPEPDPTPTYVFDDVGDAGTPPAPVGDTVDDAGPADEDRPPVEDGAEDAPEDTSVESVDEPEDTDAGADAAPQPAEDEEGPEPTPAAATVDSRQQREQSLAEIRPGLLRKLKRALQDVQNDVLDALRRGGDAPELEALLPDDEALTVVNVVGEQFLSDAYEAGLRDGAVLADRELPGDATDASRVPARAATFAAVISHEVTAALRATLSAGIDAGEPPTSLSERVGEIFRDLKGPVAEVTVDEHLSRTYGYGTLDAWSAMGIAAKEWVPGIAPRCPEEMRGQNADAGAVDLGAEFPTGQVVPPAHDGCDCTLVPR